MTEYRSTESGLFVPVEPVPVPSDKERRAAARKAFYAQHSVCPECGRQETETTCMGTISMDPDRHVDNNFATCVCGWSGKVVDLVPEVET